MHVIDTDMCLSGQHEIVSRKFSISECLFYTVCLSERKYSDGSGSSQVFSVMSVFGIVEGV